MCNTKQEEMLKDNSLVTDIRILTQILTIRAEISNEIPGKTMETQAKDHCEWKGAGLMKMGGKQ